MIEETDFNRPIPSFRRPVPPPDEDPDDGDQWCVKFNKAYLPYILGSLQQLLLQSTWDVTSSTDLNLAQNRMNTLIYLFMIGSEECEVGLQLRACTLACGIEYSTDGGDNWTCIDLTTCISDISNGVIQDRIDDGTLQQPGGQPGPETPPEFEGCQTFHVKLSARDIWHCPFPVGSGWTVIVENTKGGWTDGTLAWYCPDGARYLFGACSEDLKATSSGDPLNTKPHMQVIGHIGSTYFDPLTLYTIPANLPVYELYLHANDASLTDDLGEIEFDVTVCNETKIWTHIFDFRGSAAHGWANYSPYTSALGADGWSAAYHFGIRIPMPVGSAGATLSHIEWWANNYLRDAMNVGESGTGCTVGPVSMNHTGYDMSPPWCFTDGNYFYIYKDDAAGVRIGTITLHGYGDDPFAGL